MGEGVASFPGSPLAATKKVWVRGESLEMRIRGERVEEGSLVPRPFLPPVFAFVYSMQSKTGSGNGLRTRLEVGEGEDIKYVVFSSKLSHLSPSDPHLQHN